MWKHEIDNAGEYIFLHDCYTRKIKVEGNDIVFFFDNGFWARPKTKYSTLETPVRTEPSEMKLIETDVNGNSTFEVVYYKRGRFFWNRNHEKVLRTSVKEFIKKVNQKGGNFEFTEEYYYLDSVILFGGYLTSPKDRIYKEYTQIRIYCKKSTYYWNDLCENKKW